MIEPPILERTTFREYQPSLLCKVCLKHAKHKYDGHQRFVVTETKLAIGDGRKKCSFKLDPGAPKAESRPVYSCLECEEKRIWGSEEV